MVDYRTNKSVGGRINLEFNRHPNPLLRKRRIVSWAVFVVSLAVAGIFLAQGNKRVFWAGELSSSHKLFQNDCRQCHDQRFQPAIRFATFDHTHHSVSVEACRICHSDFSNLDHNRFITHHDEQFIQNCVACHIEHQGDVSLSLISDSHCVNCHSDLQVKDVQPNFFSQISSLSDHPNFAIHRASTGDLIGAEHLVNGLASRGGDGVWADQAQIKFNHNYHLEPQGLPVPPGHPEYGDGTFRKELTCDSCHEPDDAGRYMKPINYEKHCAECHRLEYRTELSLVGKDDPLPLPHEDPTIIRSLLRDRLMAYANAFPEKTLRPSGAQVDELEPSEPRHPNKSRPASPSAKDKWTWVEDKISQMERALACRTTGDRLPSEQWDDFVMPPDDIIGAIQTGCAHCHFLERPTNAVGADNVALLEWDIVPPRIPDRWMPHSRFDHSKHVNVADILFGPAIRNEDQLLSKDDRSCLVCHDPRIAHAPGSALGADPDSLRLSSKNTTDILIPSIKVCQSCHTKQKAKRELKSAHVSGNCVECHKYHHAGEEHPRVPELPDMSDAK